MSDLIHAKYAKIVDTGGDLDAATQRKLIGDENLSIIIEGRTIEQILSDNPNPHEIHEVGTKAEAKFVLAAADRNDFNTVIGGTYAAGTLTKSQGIRALSQYDLRFAVNDTSDATHLIDLTKMWITPKIEYLFKEGDRWYLPIEAKGSDETVFTHDEP